MARRRVDLEPGDTVAKFDPLGSLALPMPVADADMRVRSTLRRMAWGRVQGEMTALLATYWGDGENAEYDAVDAALHQFVFAVEEVLT